MLHLRALGLLDETALTATGEPLARVLDWWQIERRRRSGSATASSSRTASIPTTSS